MIIPEDILKQIEDEAIKESSSPSDYEWIKKYYLYGYSLSQQEIDKKDLSYKALTDQFELLAEKIIKKDKEIDLLKNEIDQRNDYYENKIEALIRQKDEDFKEIERLKGLIEKAHDYGHIHCEKNNLISSWQQFKQINQL